jgi:hypothetical protein
VPKINYFEPALSMRHFQNLAFPALEKKTGPFLPLQPVSLHHIFPLPILQPVYTIPDPHKSPKFTITESGCVHWQK